MTILVTRDSPLRVIDHSASSSLQGPHVHPHPTGTQAPPLEDDFVVVDFEPLCSALPVGKLRSPTQDQQLLDDDTASTGSLSSDSYDSDTSSEQASSLRRVSFNEDNMVTEVWTRPFTPRGDVQSLFYSTEETTRFRQEYRLERKLLSELAVDPETCNLDDKDLAALVSASCPGAFSTGTGSPQAYRISRVVVLHENKLETFVDDSQLSMTAGAPNTTTCANTEAWPEDSNKYNNVDDFFDNDSFWSGSITWY